MKSFDPPLQIGESIGTHFDRRAFLRLSLGAMAASLAGCASTAPPVAGPTVSVVAATPRVGDSWLYQFTSGWSQIPSRPFSVRVLEVTGNTIRDELTSSGGPADVRNFTGNLDFVARTLSGASVTEFAPYLQAFTALAGQTWWNIPMPVGAAPLTPWTAQARVRGVEAVSTPAGTFEATRVELFARRAGAGVAPSADMAQMQAVGWYVPRAKRIAKFQYNTWTLGMNPIDREGYELLEMRLGS